MREMQRWRKIAAGAEAWDVSGGTDEESFDILES
jgi:hypothetical protein